MSRTSMKSIRAMNAEELAKRIHDAQGELAKLRIDLAKGTLRKGNGKIRPLRRDIARMLTYQTEMRRS